MTSIRRPDNNGNNTCLPVSSLANHYKFNMNGNTVPVYVLFACCVILIHYTENLQVVALSPYEIPLSATRRAVLVAPIASLCLPANAFDNAIPEYKKYADKPKRRGMPPKDLGVLPRTTEGEDDTITQPGLRTCDGNPNCFSTTGDFRLEDRQQYGIDFFIAPWKPPANDPTPLKTVASQDMWRQMHNLWKCQRFTSTEKAKTLV